MMDSNNSDSISEEIDCGNRPPLKEITENNSLSPTTITTSTATSLTAGNKIGIRRSSEKLIADNSGLENKDKDIAEQIVSTNIVVNEKSDKCENPGYRNANNKKEIYDKLGNNIVDREKSNGSEISSTNENFNSAILPDIVNVLPSDAPADSPTLSALASQLLGLKINTPTGKPSPLALPVPINIDAHSAISSDDEIYSECQTTNNSNDMATTTASMNQSIRWEDIVSSVTSTCPDSLENTVEQCEATPLNLEVNDAAASVSLPSPPLPSNQAQLNSSSSSQTVLNETVGQADTTTVDDSILNKLETSKQTVIETNEINNTTNVSSESNVTIVVQQSEQNESVKIEKTIRNDERPDVTFTSNVSNENTSFIVPTNENKFVANTSDDTHPDTKDDECITKCKKELLNEIEAKVSSSPSLSHHLNLPEPEPMDVDESSIIIEPLAENSCVNSTRIISKDNSSPMKIVAAQECSDNGVANETKIIFKKPVIPPTINTNRKNLEQGDYGDEEFSSNGMILSPSDFAFLLSKGSDNDVTVERNSLLLKFDPLLGHSVPANSLQLQQQQQLLLQENSSNAPGNLTRNLTAFEARLSPAFEEDDSQFAESLNPNSSEISLNSTQPAALVYDSNSTTSVDTTSSQEKIASPNSSNESVHVNSKQLKDRINRNQPEDKEGNVKMSVDVIQDMKIENDVKSIENIDSRTDLKKDFKMAELDKKIKNEVLKTEDVEKKLKESEQREEALLKRIAEKDRTTAKMNGVLEAYEKAIAELIAEKEQIIQNYEKQLTEIKADRDQNYQHLSSLEVTFSDIHAKYERLKDVADTLRASEDTLCGEKNQLLENLRLQEQRYDKMKNHAMQQLEIANNKLETLSKNHAAEVIKLKALLKKEEISRLSIAEQLQQKSRENEELVKICDELINGQGSS